MEKLFLKVTNDKYELPVAVAGSAQELARMTGSTVYSINSAISHAKKDGRKTCYRKVIIEDDEQ